MVSSEFFLPFFDKKSRIMIAGSGQQCCVRSFISKSLYKHKNDNHENAAVFSNDKRNCDCCLICWLYLLILTEILIFHQK